ncbi:hypothetical protein [Streptomyces cinerochromogenes]|uniref:hypothetical protein n=1 Tax=Streptomyces cinerochromogenes TaxID=66422 RepID=UPI001670F1F7|nr:hypothetical protein [Streptomyces cinerochromogenes]GGS95139.1 hypothetical protein GCM10010206_67220 [Streptomyces cinerochromogenes]
MTESTTLRRDGQTPAETRAERRRLIEAIRALRRILDGRRAFELADRRRLNREARDRARAEAACARTLQRVHERRLRRERSLDRRLNGMDGKRERRERLALAVLRRESVEASLRATRLSASEVNGIGAGLVRALAAEGIRTAADFTRVSWGKAPNGKGGEVLYIHRVQGRKVHINGIGEHRGRPLMEWRRAAVARAEARAPRELPPDQRHRIAEIIEAERARLQAELAEVPREADSAHGDAVRLRTDTLARLADAAREADRLAAERRAEFDAMAEDLLALQAELTAHVERYGNAGPRLRHAQSRALRPLPSLRPLPPQPSQRSGASQASGASEASGTSGTSGVSGAAEKSLPAIPAPRTPGDSASAARPGQSAPGTNVRASLGWLLPVLLFAFLTVAGVGELGDTTPPLWLRVGSRLIALAATAELLRLWIPRRRPWTAAPMPSGTGAQATGAFLAVVAAGMFGSGGTGLLVPACATSALAVLLLLGGTGRRAKG